MCAPTTTIGIAQHQREPTPRPKIQKLLQKVPEVSVYNYQTRDYSKYIYRKAYEQRGEQKNRQTIV